MAPRENSLLVMRAEAVTRIGPVTSVTSGGSGLSEPGRATARDLVAGPCPYVVFQPATTFSISARVASASSKVGTADPGKNIDSIAAKSSRIVFERAS